MPKYRDRHQQHAAALWLPLLLLVYQGSAQLEPPGTKLSEVLLKRYLSNDEQAAWLQEFAHKCKDISKVYSVGKSVLGQNLWVLEVSDKPGQVEAEPNFLYIANMHGDEPSGRVLLAQLAERLCAGYRAQEAQALRVVRQMHLHIMPSMNPDGFTQRRRSNAKKVDLNRNFPDPIELRHNTSALLQPLPDAQPETRAIMDWMTHTQFTASANLHEGAVVANYPFDGYTDHSGKVNGTRNPSPDDATFTHLARVYAAAHKTMAQSTEFMDGIVNGAQWYPVYGGMQDWQYLAAGCMDITLELSDDKWRPESDLGQLWEENKDALLALPIAAVLGGVHGTVVSDVDGSPLPATIVVEGIARNVSATKQLGYYNRPLAPGRYKLTALHPGYAPASAQVVIPEDGSGARQDFKLTAAPAAGGAGAGASRPEGLDEGLGVLSHPALKHVVLRSHHVMLLAVVGVLLCGGGGWVLLRVHGGWPAGLLKLPRRREYELVSTTNSLASANGALRV